MIPTGIPLKSNPLTATHTCTRTLDTLTQTWHSARPDSYTSLRLGTADRRGPPSPGVRRKHLDYYFSFFFLYSRRTVQGHMRVINGASNLLQEKLKSPDSKSNTLLYSYQLFPAHFVMLLWCYSNKKNLDMEMEFYLNLLEWFSTSVRWRANRKLFGKVWLTRNSWIFGMWSCQSRPVEVLKCCRCKIVYLDVSHLSAPPWLVHSCLGELLPMTSHTRAHQPKLILKPFKGQKHTFTCFSMCLWGGWFVHVCVH